MPNGHAPPLRPSVRLLPDLSGIPGEEWDACAGTQNPFVRHAFLRLLEESGSVGADTGWHPRHLVLEDGSGRLIGAVPLYLKTHSYGEYVFDHAWANAWQRAGHSYYPKLQATVPFTPVTGPRLLIRPDAPSDTAGTLIGALARLTEDNGLSSAHVTFPTQPEHERLGQAGWLQRLGTQYHWENPGYGRFEDFLDALSSRKRKAVRRERRAVAESGATLHVLTGADLREEHWDSFYRFYQSTSDRKWGWAYLTREFFQGLGDRMPDQVVLVMARLDGRWIAGALNLLGADTLYGRNWGGIADVPFLHFETCYYQAIDFAIERGLKRVEAGAQGEHKIQRGYLPVPTYSAHYIPDPAFRAAVADFLKRERAAVMEEMTLLAEESPYRKDTPGSS